MSLSLVVLLLALPAEGRARVGEQQFLVPSWTDRSSGSSGACRHTWRRGCCVAASSLQKGEYGNEW